MGLSSPMVAHFLWPLGTEWDIVYRDIKFSMYMDCDGTDVLVWISVMYISDNRQVPNYTFHRWIISANVDNWSSIMDYPDTCGIVQR